MQSERRRTGISLSGHIVLVTGAASGIVLATDLCTGEGIDLAHEVTSEGDWAAVTTEIEARHGRHDGLVGGASAQPIER